MGRTNGGSVAGCGKTHSRRLEEKKKTWPLARPGNEGTAGRKGEAQLEDEFGSELENATVVGDGGPEVRITVARGGATGT